MLVLLMAYSSLGVHCAYAGNQNFIKSKFSMLLAYFLYKLNTNKVLIFYTVSD